MSAVVSGQASPAPARVSLMGMQLDRLAEREVIARVLSEAQASRGGTVLHANLDVLRRYWREPELRPLFERASLVLADGAPLVWASRLKRTEVPERVAGSTLLWTLSAAAAGTPTSVFLLGGAPDTAEAAAARLVENAPALQVAGTFCPPLGFEHDRAQLDQIDRVLESAAPGVVFVGLGFPKQEKLMERLRERFPGIWFIAVGFSFSFAAGAVARAPLWMQRVGLEWLHRLAQEPKRLFRRYVIEDLPFLGRLLVHSGRAGLRHRLRAR